MFINESKTAHIKIESAKCLKSNTIISLYRGESKKILLINAEIIEIARIFMAFRPSLSDEQKAENEMCTRCTFSHPMK